MASQIHSDEELLKFKDYYDYLDSLITNSDMYYLQDKKVIRNIIELGFHVPGTLDKKTFEKRVQNIKKAIERRNKMLVTSAWTNPTDSLLTELAARERSNRLGVVNTIIFLKNKEKSAYIDYKCRLDLEDWYLYFNGSKKLFPKKTDLSYYNWRTRLTIVNDSPNYKPVVEKKSGFAFKNLHDSTVVTVDNNSEPDPGTTRTKIRSALYGYAVLFDHEVQLTSRSGL